MKSREITLSPGHSQLLSIQELLGYQLHIPPFQRPYDWLERQVLDFIKDLSESRRKGTPLFCGMVVFAPDHDNKLLIVDGQQRLTTFMLALAAVGKSGLVLTTSPRRPWIRTRKDDEDCVVRLVSGKPLPKGPETQSQVLLQDAHNLLKKASSDGAIKDSDILNANMIIYVAPSVAGATGLFERINLRGRDVSQFDLVKNKLIDWTQVVTDKDRHIDLQSKITETYDKLYKMLNPIGHDGEQILNSDRLLRVHWILFDPHSFKSSEKVLECLEARLWENHESPDKLCDYICDYLDSLQEVCAEWVSVQRPYNAVINSHPLRSALLDFKRLNTEGEYEPIIVAAMLRFRSSAHKVIRFCEISMLRSVLSKHRANTYRSAKWRLGKAIYQGSLKDAGENPITTVDELINQLFWKTSPFWSSAESHSLNEPLSKDEAASLVLPENALSNPEFYNQYRVIIKYFFWKYGVFLSQTTDPNLRIREEMRHFTDELWFERSADSFDKWDIEHIYPCNPDDRHKREGRAYEKKMKPWLHHIGNLTLLPRSNNRSVGNIDFESKLREFKDIDKVSFNLLLEKPGYRGNLLDRPRWGASNCTKRLENLRKFAEHTWGSAPLRELGVSPMDASVEIDNEDDEGDDD